MAGPSGKRSRLAVLLLVYLHIIFLYEARLVGPVLLGWDVILLDAAEVGGARRHLADSSVCLRPPMYRLHIDEIECILLIHLWLSTRAGDGPLFLLLDSNDVGLLCS